MTRHAVVGCIPGTASGDALGLAYEGLSRNRARRMLGPPSRHRFFFGRSVAAHETTQQFADSLGLARGVTGYTFHSVPVAVHAWLSHPHDYRAAVTAMIECGGDADTTAAIVGGIIGAGVGEAGIPAEWKDGIYDWPRSVRWMRQPGEQLADARNGKPNVRTPRLNPLAVLRRNLVFLLVVPFYGFRRLAPPY